MHVDDHEIEFKKYLSIEVSKFKSVVDNIDDINRYKTIFLTRVYKNDTLLFHNDILDERENYTVYHVDSFRLGGNLIKLNLLHSPRIGFINASGNPIILNNYQYQYQKNSNLPREGRIIKLHIYYFLYSFLAYASFFLFYLFSLRKVPIFVNKYLSSTLLTNILTVFVLWSLVKFGIEEFDNLYRIDPKFKIFLFLLSDILSVFYLLIKVKLVSYIFKKLNSEHITLSFIGTFSIYSLYLYVKYYIGKLSYNFDVNHGLQLTSEQFVFLVIVMLMSAFMFMAMTRDIGEDRYEINFSKKLLYLFAIPLAAALIFSFFITINVLIILSLFILLLIFSFDIYKSVEEKRLTYYVWWIVFQAVYISFILYQPSKLKAQKDFDKLITSSFYKANKTDIGVVKQFSKEIIQKGYVKKILNATESEILEVSDIRNSLLKNSSLKSNRNITLESVDIFYKGKSLVKGGLYNYETIKNTIRKKAHSVSKNIYYMPTKPHYTLNYKGLDKSEIFITFKVNNYSQPEFPYQITRNNVVVEKNNLLGINLGTPKYNTRVNTRILELENEYKAYIYTIEKGFIGPISLFTLIFAFGVIGILLLIVINNKFNLFPLADKKSIKFADSSSLSFRIQVTIVGLSIIIFTVIGIMTTIYLNRMSSQESAQKSRVSADLLIKYINEELGNNNDFNSMKNYLTIQNQRLSELFEGYIDLYDSKGFSIISSRGANSYVPNLPAKELKSIKESLSKFNQGMFASFQVNDKYSIIEIKSTQNSNQLLYLGYSPSILRYSNVEKEYVRTYIGTMLNVYIFLFLLATAIAITISNTVTNPLTILKNNLRTYKFGKTHPKLEWASNDEIGELINEYNLLTDEITKSADLLAKTEREMAWREMAKQVAHEIKNPLTPMKLSLQYLEKTIKDDPERAKGLIQKICGTLMEQINNLTQIADSFSNFATLPKTSNERIILNEVVEAIHDLFRKREDMDIEMLEPVNDIHVFADRNHLVRILNNVVKNATQAIAEDKRGKIEIELTKIENKAVIRVSDNGSGISEAMKPKVFTPNFTSKSSGTGLGLAICANMLESMNGRIYFESVEGQGTDFFIELPLLRDDLVDENLEVVILE